MRRGLLCRPSAGAARIGIDEHSFLKLRHYVQKVVFDRFHVMWHAHFAVDRVRVHEQKELRAHGDRRLMGTKFWWLKNPATLDRLSAAAPLQFEQLKRSSLKSARAWALKKSFRKRWGYRSIAAPRAFIKQWLAWAKRSRLPAMIYFADIIERRLENILTYLTHRIMNAVSEGLNAKIQWIKYASRGFRNRKRFKLAILFHLGGLSISSPWCNLLALNPLQSRKNHNFKSDLSGERHGLERRTAFSAVSVTIRQHPFKSFAKL